MTDLHIYTIHPADGSGGCCGCEVAPTEGDAISDYRTWENSKWPYPRPIRVVAIPDDSPFIVCGIKKTAGEWAAINGRGHITSKTAEPFLNNRWA